MCYEALGCDCSDTYSFLLDLEVRLGESVVISQVGDIVLRHCLTFRSLYVPYVTNMMYQEALVTLLLWVFPSHYASVNVLSSFLPQSCSFPYFQAGEPRVSVSSEETGE